MYLLGKYREFSLGHCLLLIQMLILMMIIVAIATPMYRAGITNVLSDITVNMQVYGLL